MANEELAVLQALRLKGRGKPDDLSEATGVAEAQVADLVTGLVEAGAAREVNGSYMLMPDGRERLAALLADERSGVDTAAVKGFYDDFTAVNGDFKQLATDWQLRDGEPNDHGDAAYDAEVLGRLGGIHARTVPIVDAVAAIAPRLAPYKDRLASALARVEGGDTTWLLRPLIDSYHTVWFELHEELIGLAGLSRQDEAASGRAE
jgi:hypothetical protein